jgi:phosphomannomutase/phosphoglucomutase
MKISDTIFRAYDIRGIYNDDITDETAYTLGKSFGTYVLERGATEVLVGHDNRLSSPVLSENLIKGLLETGVNVTDLGLVTTPMYYYARSFLNKWSAVMITASHNPSNHNGFKISFDSRGNAAGEEIQAFKDYTNAGNFVTGKGIYSTYDIRENYINLLVNSLKLGNKKIKLVIDCGNGTCSLVIKDILDRLNVTYDLLYCESDGNFPNHHPDPSVSSNLVDLQKRVLELNYDLGIAVDADGDRVRIIDNKGNIINSDIFMIVMYRYLNDSLKVRKALFDVKCSKALLDALDDLKIEKIMYRTGNSYMFRKVNEDHIEYAAEYSGHMWFGDRFKAFDDGIYAGLRMVEVLSNTDKTLNDLCSDVNTYYSTDEIKVNTTETGKVEIVDRVKLYAESKEYKFNDIDGIRVEFEDGWALIRYSNTGPSVTIRFEANTEKRLQEINDEFMDVINEIIKQII